MSRRKLDTVPGGSQSCLRQRSPGSPAPTPRCRSLAGPRPSACGSALAGLAVELDRVDRGGLVDTDRISHGMVARSLREERDTLPGLDEIVVRR